MAPALALRPVAVRPAPGAPVSLFHRLGSSTSLAVSAVAASAFMGVIASGSVAVATLHLVVTLGAVVAVGLLARSPGPVLAVTVYAGTCDVFWRSASARGPYEGGKYALVFGFACLAFRFLRRPRNRALVVGLIALLIPGAVLGVAGLGLASGREYAAANLSGLLALAIGAMACSNLRLSPVEMRGIYLTALSPAISIGAIATLATVTSKDLSFGTESNFAAAGGFGPVQVSSMLSFGALLCILVLLQREAPWRMRAMMLATGTWMVAQAVLTFSRGGVFSLVLSVACIGLAALTVSGHRTRTVVAAGVLALVALQVLSWAGGFTGGASEERFSSTNSTNRTDLARADLDLFMEEPLLGVGVGQAKFQRDWPIQSAPHTEYTRLLAEHGLLGLGVLVILGVFTVRIIKAGAGWYRMAAVGLVAMSLSQMAHSATRIGCIALGFALAALREDLPERVG